MAGDADELCVITALESLADFIADGDETGWVIDMSQVDYLSSAGFGRLVALHKKADARDIEVRFAAIQPDIMEVLEAMRLDEAIDLFPTVAEACSVMSA